MTLDERLKQIYEWGVPHLVRGGHSMGDGNSSYQVVDMHGDVPEVLLKKN
ncbi:hypothetical protein J4218_04695 [Candidatus Pacearchaeota archaeon]|nr:hypothetical protein [Candidatus Pacearchaeota archaeon]